MYTIESILKPSDFAGVWVHNCTLLVQANQLESYKTIAMKIMKIMDEYGNQWKVISFENYLRETNSRLNRLDNDYHFLENKFDYLNKFMDCPARASQICTEWKKLYDNAMLTLNSLNATAAYSKTD